MRGRFFSTRDVSARRRAVSPAAGRAFSIIELLVVVAVMGLLLGVVGLSLKSLMGKSPELTSANQVVAALSNARNLAMQNGQDTAVFFFTGANGQTYLRIGQLRQAGGLSDKEKIETIPNGGGADYALYKFQALRDDRPAVALAQNVSIAATDSSSAFIDWRGPMFAVWYGADGKLVTSKDGLPSLVVWVEADPQTNVINTEIAFGQPVPFVSVYRIDLLFNAVGVRPVAMTGGRADLHVNRPSQQDQINEWIVRNGKSIIFNRFTGNVFRG